MTLDELTDLVLRDPVEAFRLFKGLYIVKFDITAQQIILQAEYSGELVRELPQHLVNKASVSVGTGYTEMLAKTTHTIDSDQVKYGDCWWIKIVLT